MSDGMHVWPESIGPVELVEGADTGAETWAVASGCTNSAPMPVRTRRVPGNCRGLRGAGAALSAALRTWPPRCEGLHAIGQGRDSRALGSPSDVAAQANLRETELRLQKEIKALEGRLQKEIKAVEVRLTQAIHRQTVWVVLAVGGVTGLIRWLDVVLQ